MVKADRVCITLLHRAQLTMEEHGQPVPAGVGRALVTGNRVDLPADDPVHGVPCGETGSAEPGIAHRRVRYPVVVVGRPRESAARVLDPHEAHS